MRQRRSGCTGKAHDRSASRLLLVGLSAVTTLFVIAACNSILGVEDVSLKRGRDGAVIEGEDGFVEPDPETDAQPPERPNILQTSLGDQHSCARKPDGTVKCWGDDIQGQTGTGGPADGGVVLTPRAVQGIDDAVDVSAGRSHTCVARASGTLSCWGYNLSLIHI